MKGHIRQRAKGKWEITIDIGADAVTGKRRRHFETINGIKKDAQHRLAELLISIEQGRYIKKQPMLTLAIWLRQWLDGYVNGNLSPKTVDSYQHETQKYIIPRLGGIRLNDLRPEHIQKYMAEVLSSGRKRSTGGLSSRTVQYHYRILSKALDDAIRIGLMAINPCKGVRPPRLVRYDIPTLGPDELLRLMAAIRQSNYYIYFHTLIYTGLRRSELLALKWKDLDLELACMYVAHSLLRLDDGAIIIKEPKTASSRRVVDLSPSLALLLREHRINQETEMAVAGRKVSENGYVFCHMDGTPLIPSSVTHTFSKVAKKAGFPQLRLHDLRHIHATLLLKGGQHPKVVQERLGHSSITTTLDIYSHTVPGMQKAAAERLDVLLPTTEEVANVGKMSVEEEEVESRPYRPRTCDTLIKSQVLNLPRFSKLSGSNFPNNRLHFSRIRCSFYFLILSRALS
ncbi:tyrosine-type recombinase/integrase [Chloroflexota bacterium]